MDQIPVVLTPNIWMFSLLAAGTLLLGMLRYSYPQQFAGLWRAAIRPTDAQRREVRFDAFNMSLEIWAILAIALSILLIQSDHIVFSDWAILVRYALLLGIFLTLQGTIYQLAGFIFEDSAAYAAAWREKSQFLRWSAIWLTPLIWWLAFAGEYRVAVGYVGAALLIVLYLWSLARLTIVLFRQSQLRSYHNLLYLCALEISPVLIIALMM
ncbi:MAG: DUF4271 domain-containing protein [Flavobacteriia bacterium]|nr:DUF4271 domain-containing protein [Flavobacteriia bacterium]